MQSQMSTSGFDEIASTSARLFLAKGFAGVGLRTIANELGIKAASLYHHCPGGKAELYVRSMSVFLDGYAEKLLASRGRSAFPESLLRMATFTIAENNIDLRRIVTRDLPNLPTKQQNQLNKSIHQVLLGPFVEEFEAAKRAGKAKRRLDSQMAAACVLAIADNIGGLHLPPSKSPTAEQRREAEQLVRAGVALLLDGVRD